MKNILITGGCGFIGSNFIRYLLQQDRSLKIVNIDKLTYAGNLHNLSDLEQDQRYSFVRGDICDSRLLDSVFSEEGIDSVVHFAAESHVDRSISGPESFVETNVVGTFRLLEAARKAWLDTHSGPCSHRFCHVSTDEVYGSLGETGYFSEETPYDPRSPYSATKASSDHLVSAYFHTYGLETVTTNCSNNYGAYQFPEKLIPLIVNNALYGRELPVYGDGGNVRDWLYVEDHCSAIWAVLNGGKGGETYNIGGNSEKRNIEVVETICGILDEVARPLRNGLPRHSLIRFVKDRPGHDRRYAIDASKIRNELGWQPSVSFEIGIRRTVEWYLANPAWIEAVLDGSYQEYYRSMYTERLKLSASGAL